MAKNTMVSHEIVVASESDLTPFVWRTDVAPFAGDIDIDNDGEIIHVGVLDLSSAVSQVIGKQCSQYATYRVNYISVHMENRNDGLDNDDGANFGGRIEFFKPNAHNINAMQAVRTIDREQRKELLSREGGMFNEGTGSTRYTTPRFNFFVTDQKVVAGVTQIPVWSDAGLGDWPALEPLFGAWDGSMLQANQADYENEIWSRRVGLTQKLHWSASYINNEDGSNYAPRSNAFTWQSQGNDLEVLGGLMQLRVEHCSTDSPGTVDDDYSLHVTVGISGWEAF